jgi:hypothetical protein
MRRIITWMASAIFLTGLAFADEWDGKLVDANCTNPLGGVHACDPATTTTNFGIVINGDSYLLNNKGNRKAAAAVKFRAETTDADHPAVLPVNVIVTGKKAGKTILVDSLVIDTE